MATIQELRAAGALTTVATPIPEPLNAPSKFPERLKRFGEHYNLSNDSHLYRYLVALCGDTGAGSLKRELLLPRLQAQLESTHFLNLDRIYGNALLLPRLDAELYAYDPENDILLQQQWAEVYAKDAAYRARCLIWMRAIISGSTLEGMALAAEAAIGVECDIYERYRFLEHQQFEESLNLIANDSFETNTTGWTASGTGAAISRITTDAKFGVASLQITSGSAGESRASATVTGASLVQGTSYTASYWVKGGNAGAIGETAQVLLWETGGASAAEATTFSNLTITGDWQRIETTGSIIKADRTGLTVYVGVPSGVDAADLIWVDGVIVAKQPVPYDNNATVGRTLSRNEFVILPRAITVSEEDKRRISRLVDKLKPVNTLCTIQAGEEVRSERVFSEVAASSERFYVKRLVQGNPAIDWPPVDISKGMWVEGAVEKEAPTFAFMDRQEAVTYLDIVDAIASSEHIGNFNKEQRQLFGHLAESPNETYYYSADRSFARNIAPVNLATTWTRGIGESPHDMIVINNHYPIGYFADTDTSAFIRQPQENFWSSVEELPPNSEQLTFDFGRVRPINFIDFEICHKPIDFVIEYDDAGIWKTVEPREGLPVSMSVDYLPSLANPWHYFEITFDILQTQKVRITFNRRERRFPLETSDYFPWSVELRSARLMYVVGRASDFIEDVGQDVLGNVFRTELDVKGASVISDPADVDATLAITGVPMTDAVRAASLSGDGKAVGDSSYGIWKDTVNLFTNGGYETDTTGSTGNGTTLFRDTTRSKFGVASCRATIVASGAYSDVNGSITISGATLNRSYSASLWVYADVTQAGRTYNLYIRETGGASGTAQTSSSFVLALGWNRLFHTKVVAQNDRTGIMFLVLPSNDIGNVVGQRFWIDGVQIEQEAVATPYVETNGSTASRADTYIDAPADILNTTQGWIAARFRPGTPYTAAQDYALFGWRQDGNNHLLLLYNSTSDVWTFHHTTGGDNDQAAVATPLYAAGDELTVVATWTATEIKISVNGGAFSTTALTHAPPVITDMIQIGSSNDQSQLNGDMLWFAAGTGELDNADAAAFHAYGDTDPERNADLPGNSQLLWQANTSTYFRNTGMPDPLNYWSSKPNPSRHGVEALYFDMRQGDVQGTMQYLNTQFMDELDERSMDDMIEYHANGQIIDEVYIDPVTYGCDMHFYYSDDDDPNWDEKLWTPIPRQYILKKGFFALPQPTYVRYFKIEFSNLAAMPYQAPDYPIIPVVQYNRYPSWVEDYFAMAYIDRPITPDLLEVVEEVIIDPIKFGFQKVGDRLISNFEAERILMVRDTDDEVKTYITTVIEGRETEDRTLVESKIKFRSPLMWQTDLVNLLDPTRALSRVAQKSRNGLIDTGWSAELGLPLQAMPLQASTQNQAENIREKQAPILWFPRRTRHTYKTIEAPLTKKLAYFAAVKTVSFHRRDYVVDHDETVYYESLSDGAHIESTDFVQNDWRYEIDT